MAHQLNAKTAHTAAVACCRREPRHGGRPSCALQKARLAVNRASFASLPQADSRGAGELICYNNGSDQQPSREAAVVRASAEAQRGIPSFHKTQLLLIVHRVGRARGVN